LLKNYFEPRYLTAISSYKLCYDGLSLTVKVTEDHIICFSLGNGRRDTPSIIRSLKNFQKLVTERSIDSAEVIGGKATIEFSASKPSLNLKYSNKKFAEINLQKTNNYITLKVYSPLDEKLFGLGEKASHLNLRGRKYRLLNSDPSIYRPGDDPLYINVPFLMFVRKDFSYGILLDTTQESIFDLDSSNKEEVSIIFPSDSLGFYLLIGPEPKDVVSKLTSLLGRDLRPPLWAFGFHQSRAPFPPVFPMLKATIGGFKTMEKVMEIASKFREKNIPCDAIYLDIDHMDNYVPFTWHPKRFRDHKKWLEKLREMGFKIVAIVDPYIGMNPEIVSEKGRMFLKRNHSPLVGYGWLGRVLLPDFTNPETRKWWSDLHRVYLEAGVSGIWNDMNEPTIDVRIFRKTDYRGIQTSKGDFKKYRNLYANQEAEATTQAFRKYLKSNRPFILSRAGYAGIQNYAFVWTGDNISSWIHLRLSISMLLNLGLSGIPYAGADIGGWAKIMLKPPFFVRCTPELYARWIELGIFYPFTRAHSMLFSQEPWDFGREVESIARKYIKLRYRLLPYIYSLTWEYRTKGLPLMRPLFLHFPQEEESYRDDEFLFGPSILVAPILEKGKTSRTVYLPRGCWYDFWTLKKLKGGKSYSVEAPLGHLPLFIKEGAIIPTWKSMNYVGELQSPLFIEIYPGNGEFTIFEDDGLSTNDKYLLTHVESRLNRESLKITLSSSDHGYSSCRDLYLVIKGCRIVEIKASMGEIRDVVHMRDSDCVYISPSKGFASLTVCIRISNSFTEE